MFTNRFLKSSALSAALLTMAVGLSLLGCKKPAEPTATPAADAAAAADTTRENELQAREDALAQREADQAARDAEAARQKEAADAAAAQAAADAAAAKKVVKKRAPAPASTTTASSAAPATSVPASPVQQRAQVPSGTAMTVALSSDLSSKTAKPGDPFEATVASNLLVNGKIAVPTGARVTGTITDVVSGSKAIGAVPMLGLKFNQLELEDGQIIPITGDLVQQGPSEKTRDTAKILGGAAAGAILGHQVKKNDSGKVIGGLLGGAIGAVAAKRTGTEVQLPAGSTLTITTGNPFSVVVH